MNMRRRHLALAALTTLAAIVLFTTEGWAGARENCEKADPSLRIAGCSAMIDKGMASAKDMAVAHHNRGDAYYHTKNYDLAIADLSRAIELDPKSVDSNFVRGKAYYRIRNYGLAIADYDKAIKLKPKDADPYLFRGTAHLDKGDFDLAIADYDKLIKLSPKDSDAYYLRGVAHEKQGERQKAVADYRKALAVRPGRKDAAAALQSLGEK